MRASIRDGASYAQPPNWWLRIRCAASPGGSLGLRMASSGDAPEIDVRYSRDGVSWDRFLANDETYVGLTDGEFVFLRAGPGGNVAMGSEEGYNFLRIRGSENSAYGLLSGNVMSLLDGINPPLSVPPYGFRSLFYAADAISEFNSTFTLPSLSLGERCYSGMFIGSRIDRIRLPAANLSEGCYEGMFANARHLESLDVYFRSWGATSGYFTGNWMENAGAATSGSRVFRCPSELGSEASIPRGKSTVPAGWTVVNTDA